MGKVYEKEQLLKERELADLEKKMGGLKTLKKLPNALVVVDIGEHDGMVREARTSERRWSRSPIPIQIPLSLIIRSRPMTDL